uniref:Fe-S cluster protein n=1 Tax=Paulinella chromatophora TaxID=39717 RepID=B1X5P2_PAUCH|nr:hypothetical protein PCC_0851 [Paulinella chromatophora]ACB43261.1 hypothetical protein PCC_0851 [Paulinella chromatophora]
MEQDPEFERWRCSKACGTCCYLDPSERQEALFTLSAVEQEIYLSMVSDDGWCIHFERNSRYCRIYNTRPSFCRVGRLIDLFAVMSKDNAAFTLACCRQQIRSLYGNRSQEMRQFERTQQTDKPYYE